MAKVRMKYEHPICHVGGNHPLSMDLRDCDGCEICNLVDDGETTRCAYLDYKNAYLEKAVKTVEYIEFTHVRIGNTIYSLSPVNGDVSFLEIDGEVLVDDEEDDDGNIEY